MEYSVKKAIGDAQKWWGEKQAAREDGGKRGAGPGASEKYQSRMKEMQAQVNAAAAAQNKR